MPVMGITERDGRTVPFYISTGYRVDRRGYRNKWEECAVYCSAEAAQFAVDRMWCKHLRTDKPVECRVVEIPV